jgi:hypothetical protein
MIFKIVITAGIVMTLSLIAEHVRPRVAGILAGFPLGFAIVVYFYGVEQGADFASASAVYTLAGFGSILMFVGAYYLTSSRLTGLTAAILAPVIGFLAYLGTSALIRLIPFNLVGALAFGIALIFVFIILFRRIENTIIINRARFGLKLIAVRALLAAAAVLAITAVANQVGAQWAGLFSAFPTTLLPLLLIIHFTYGATHVHTIIKNFPQGLGSTAVFLTIVHGLYPVLGVHLGTMVALLGSVMFSTVAVLYSERR